MLSTTGALRVNTQLANVLVMPLVSFATTAGSVTADERHVIFILDASNSMWGQIDGKAKINIAKDVLTRQFASPPEGTQAGLIA